MIKRLIYPVTLRFNRKFRYPRYIKATLDWCNERRGEKELEPLDDLPKGKRGSPRSCPCGAATGLYVSPVHATDLNRTFTLPTNVEKFVRAFDAGMIPQYDEEK